MSLHIGFSCNTPLQEGQKTNSRALCLFLSTVTNDAENVNLITEKNKVTGFQRKEDPRCLEEDEPAWCLEQLKCIDKQKNVLEID